MFGNVNRSGFGGAGYASALGAGLAGESPSAAAVADILTGVPCRTCADASEGCDVSTHAACTVAWHKCNRPGRRIA